MSYNYEIAASGTLMKGWLLPPAKAAQGLISTVVGEKTDEDELHSLPSSINKVSLGEREYIRTGSGPRDWADVTKLKVTPKRVDPPSDPQVGGSRVERDIDV